MKIEDRDQGNYGRHMSRYLGQANSKIAEDEWSDEAREKAAEARRAKSSGSVNQEPRKPFSKHSFKPKDDSEKEKKRVELNLLEEKLGRVPKKEELEKEGLLETYLKYHHGPHPSW